MPGSALEGQIPVFVYPSSLTFSLKDETTHKQILTIYNPYDFSIQYLILSNAPQKYSIPDSSGFLKPRNRVDILVRHSYPVARNVGATDKLRIQITEKGKSTILGKKDIVAQLVVSLSPPHQEQERFEELPHRRRSRSTSTASPQQLDFANIQQGGDASTAASSAESLFYVQLLTVAVCITALMMPTEGDPAADSASVPDALHLSTTFKNVASFVLGLIVCSLLRRTS